MGLIIRGLLLATTDSMTTIVTASYRHQGGWAGATTISRRRGPTDRSTAVSPAAAPSDGLSPHRRLRHPRPRRKVGRRGRGRGRGRKGGRPLAPSSPMRARRMPERRRRQRLLPSCPRRRRTG
ncbi:unnamed protein product, partial [Ectocarpus sp. 8 AP-2014]